MQREPLMIQRDFSDQAPVHAVFQEAHRMMQAAKVVESLTTYPDFFDTSQCSAIEEQIDETVRRGDLGLLVGKNTVDVTHKRTKYFFGHGYTYGQGMRGEEELLPPGTVSEIPPWIHDLVILPLEKRGIVQPGWIDSVVMNDYYKGGSIVSHIDPPQLFARPIVSASFFSPARLVFNASFDLERRQQPIHSHLLSRGCLLIMDGYAANEVTHGIRPEDMHGQRRVSLILRHVICPHPQAAPGSACGSESPAERLISLAQGCWRDPPSHGGILWFYRVKGYDVEVVDAQGNEVAHWHLKPHGDGVLCDRMLLEPKGAHEQALCWVPMSEAAGGDSPGGSRAERRVWLRIEFGHGFPTKGR